MTQDNLTYKLKTNSGFVMVALLVATMFVMIAGAATASLAASNYRSAKNDQYRLNAQLAADAGLDVALNKINQNDSWAGSGGEKELINTGDYRSTYETVVNDPTPDDFHKTVTSTGRTYAFGSTTPISERSYDVIIRGISAGNFSVVTGVGGLEMSNSSKILGGSVYVNGSIAMQNSAQIGLASLPVPVKVANLGCPTPPDSTYPRLCNPGERDNPITTLNNSHIYGTVEANNQTDASGMSSPGLTAGSVTPLPLPSHDRDAQQAAVVQTITASEAACNFPSEPTKTWPANVKIVGDLDLKKCEITAEGDVWITGDLNLSNASEIIVKSGLSDPPVIMVDGENGIKSTNSSSFSSNSSKIGFRVITYWSEASCSPDCTSVDGAALYNSSDNITINLSNSSSGPNTEFYARWSAIKVDNSGNIGAVVGQLVMLVNSSAITFGTEVSGTDDISAWIIESYKRAYN